MFNGYGLCGAIKDIKLTSEEVEKLKSNLIELDGEFYQKKYLNGKIQKIYIDLVLSNN